MAYTYIFNIIIISFAISNKFYLVILLNIEKNVELCIYCLAMIIFLAISLRRKYDKKQLFNVEKVIY